MKEPEPILHVFIAALALIATATACAVVVYYADKARMERINSHNNATTNTIHESNRSK